MKPPAKPFILLIFFAILTLISLATIIAVSQTPIEQTTTENAGTYTATASYDYTATLIPNTIYQNQTTLKPDQGGTLYANLIKQIDLTLTYTFTATFPTTTNTQYSTTRTLKTATWQYQLSTTPTQTTNQQNIQINLPTYSQNEITPIKEQIDNETGTQTNTYTTASPYYTIEITPTFNTTITTPQGPITQAFTPTLEINYNRTIQGDAITFDNLQQTQTGQLTQDQTITNSSIQDERYASYILIAVSLAGLSYTIMLYMKQKTNQPQTEETSKFMQTHKDLIIEAQENPPTTATVNLSSPNELIKTAEILAKPIIHTKNPNGNHNFTIIDNNTTYQYEDKPPKEKQKKLREF